MKIFTANPIDSIMQLHAADNFPCHLLMELDGPILKDAVEAICKTNAIWKGISSAQFIPGKFGVAPKWKLSEQENFNIQVHSFDDELDNFYPDKHLPKLQGNIRLVLVDRPDKSSWLVLSWSHTAFDAKGAEELLKSLGGVTTTATIAQIPLPKSDLAGFGKFGRYCAQRRKLKDKTHAEPIKRFYRTVNKNELWQNENSGFFRSATLLAAFLKSLPPLSGRMCLVPVLQARKRIFPGNQLGVLHLFVEDENCSLKELNNRILTEMENIVRAGLPKLSMQVISFASRFGRKALKFVSDYPAKFRFADVCMSSLGSSNLPTSFLNLKVNRIRHYPPIFPWGGTTLVYYDFGDEATLVYLGSDEEQLPKICQILKDALQ